jgi:hypothetical protein
MPYLSEAFICCYFDKEDRDCLCVQKTHALFRSDFSYERSFCGECRRGLFGQEYPVGFLQGLTLSLR